MDTGCDVTLKDVYDEFSGSIANKYGINVHKCKNVVKNFAFKIPNIDVPQTCEYLMVRVYFILLELYSGFRLFLFQPFIRFI